MVGGPALSHPFFCQQLCQAVRIVANSEDCPIRLFSAWQHITASVDKETGVDLDEEFMDAPSCAFALYKRMLEFSANLSSTLLPSAGRVEAYATTGLLSTLQEFLDDFDAPRAHRLESEIVWPMESTVPYLDSKWRG